MRKGFVVLLAAVVAVMFAVPATAGTVDFSGFYRAKGFLSNFKDRDGAPTIQKDAPTAAYVEQRLRAKFTAGEENVKVVWFSEIDMTWGDSAGSAKPADTTGGAYRNSGGALGADRINLETKNIFVWFKLPNTTLDFTVGLQNQSDAYAGLLYGGADMAGVFVNGKFDPVALTLGWAKLYENNVQKADDMTLYVASAKLAPVKEAKLGLNFYFLQDDTGETSTANQLPVDPGANLNRKRIYIPGVDFTFAAGPASLTGFLLYENGKIDYLNPATTDIKIQAFAVDLRGDLNLGPGKAFLEGIYLTGGDGSGDKYKSIITLSDVNASPGGNSFFARTDMSILLPNIDDCNTNQALIGAAGSASSQSPGNNGRGIWHVAVGYSQKLTDKITGKVGAGYLTATKLLVSDPSYKKKDMGTEFNANVNYNIMKGLDFGVYGAYALIGDFFKPNANDSPDDAYDIHTRLNYAF